MKRLKIRTPLLGNPRYAAGQRSSVISSSLSTREHCFLVWSPLPGRHHTITNCTTPGTGSPSPRPVDSRCGGGLDISARAQLLIVIVTAHADSFYRPSKEWLTKAPPRQPTELHSGEYCHKPMRRRNSPAPALMSSHQHLLLSRDSYQLLHRHTAVK